MTDDPYDNELFRCLPQADDLRLYVEEGRPMNHFLTALVENDLMECIGRADEQSLEALDAYCAWLRTYAPRACYGSAERMADWIRNRGMLGTSTGP